MGQTRQEFYNYLWGGGGEGDCIVSAKLIFILYVICILINKILVASCIIYT